MKWFVKPGCSTAKALSFINTRIQSWLDTYGQILLVVWTGTCDLTKKQRKFIDLSDNSVESIEHEYEKIHNLTLRYGDKLKVTILEVPQYSITNMEQKQGDPNPHSTRENAEILIDRVNRLNDKIRKLNSQSVSQILSPKFGIDYSAAIKEIGLM